MENGQNMLQTVANTVENTMENERFELKTVAHTVEMAVSSFKMLQIAWKMVRTGNPKKNPQTKKKNPQTISYPLYCPKAPRGPKAIHSSQSSLVEEWQWEGNEGYNLERTRGTNTDTNGRREESGVQGPKAPRENNSN